MYFLIKTISRENGNNIEKIHTAILSRILLLKTSDNYYGIKKILDLNVKY
jgi:hypothetical protein